MNKRKRNRLKDYDYSLPGYYFVTICIDKMKCTFGEIEKNKMQLNKYGKIVKKNWLQMAKIYKDIEIDEFIIMPNHIHGIIIINVGDANFASPTDRTKMLLSKVLQQYKRSCTIVIKNVGLTNFKWQRSFYDRIIRNEKELYNIRKYIQQNPLKWEIEEKIVENIDL